MMTLILFVVGILFGICLPSLIKYYNTTLTVKYPKLLKYELWIKKYIFGPFYLVYSFIIVTFVCIILFFISIFISLQYLFKFLIFKIFLNTLRKKDKEALIEMLPIKEELDSIF